MQHRDQGSDQHQFHLIPARPQSSQYTDFDRLPLLRPPQLNNVQDVSTVAWFSALDGKPYVRIRLRTKGTVCRACFHDLSPRKQQDLIDRLRAKREGRLPSRPGAPPTGPPTEEEAERLLQLIIYMEKHKRPLASGSGAATERGEEMAAASEGEDEPAAPQPRQSSHQPESAGPSSHATTSPRAPTYPTYSSSSHHFQQPPAPPPQHPIHLPNPFPSYAPYHPPQHIRPQYYPHEYAIPPAAQPADDPYRHIRDLQDEHTRLRNENAALRDDLRALRDRSERLERENRELMIQSRQQHQVGRQGFAEAGTAARPIILPPHLEEILNRHLPSVQASMRDVIREALLAMDGELRRALQPD